MEPAVAPAPRRFPYRLAIVVGIAVLAIVGGYLFRDRIASLHDRAAFLIAPEDIQGMTVLYRSASSTSQVNAATISRRGVGPIEALNAYGSVESLAQAGDYSVAIVRLPRSSTVEVVRVTGGGLETLATGTEEKRAIAVSPDGKHVAWAQAVSPSEGVPYTAATDTWSVMLRSAAGTRSVGTGYGPQFIDSDTLLFTAADRLSLVALPDGQAETQPYLGSASIARTAKAGNGMLLVPLPDRPIYLAYRILAARPLMTEPLAELPEAFQDLAIGDEAVYGLRTEEGRQQIMRMPFDSVGESSRAFTLPRTMSVSSLIP